MINTMDIADELKKVGNVLASVETGNLERLKEFLPHVIYSPRFNYEMLCKAMKNGHLDIVQFFLENKQEKIFVDINNQDLIKSIASPVKSISNDLVAQAVQSQNIEVLKYTLNYIEKNISVPLSDDRYISELWHVLLNLDTHHAVEKMNLLINHGTRLEDIIEEESFVYKALTPNVVRNKTEMLEALRSHGVNLYKHSKTLLLYAAKFSTLDTFKYVEKLYVKNNFLSLPFYRENIFDSAIAGGNLETIAYMLEQGCKISVAFNKGNQAVKDYCEKLELTRNLSKDLLERPSKPKKKL